MKNLIRLFDFISAAAVPYGIVLTPAIIPLLVPSIKINKPRWSNPLFLGIALIGLFLIEGTSKGIIAGVNTMP